MHQLETTYTIKELAPLIKAIITKQLNARPKDKDNRPIKETYLKITILNK